MSKTATLKEVTEVAIGGYTIALDEEKMDLLYQLANCQERERKQLQELTDFFIDEGCNGGLPDEDCLRYLRYLRNLRGAFEYVHQIGVKKQEPSPA